MKRFLVMFVFVNSMLYADLQTLFSKGMTVGLYDDTAFGFSFSLEQGVFLKLNRPPTSLLMMFIDGKMLPIGSAAGFFHQRPLLTNNTLFVAWEVRGLLWKISIRPMDKPPLGEGFLFFISVTNVEKQTQTFRLQALFDVVAPFESPVLVGNHIQKITQESLWQGRSLVTQWAVYSEKTNLPGMTVVALEPSWQRVAFADWKQFYDYPGEAVVRKQKLFDKLSVVGATFFYPTIKLARGESYSISYWIGKSLPPEGVVKREQLPEVVQPQPVIQPPLTNTNLTLTNTNAIFDTHLLLTNTNTVTSTYPLLTNTNVVEKQKPEEWRFTLGGFASKAYCLTDEQQTRLSQWFTQIEDVRNVVFVVTGHADRRGTRKENFLLGQQRAEAVAKWLQAQKVPSNHIVILSKGEDDSVSLDLAVNRRVEIIARRKE